MDLLLDAKGPTAIAEEIGCSRMTVYRDMESDEFQATLDARREARNRLARAWYSCHVRKAAQTQLELMEKAESENVRLAASKEIISNAGFADISEVHVSAASIRSMDDVLAVLDGLPVDVLEAVLARKRGGE